MASLTAITTEEPNVAVQKNMLAYLASLLQNVCDYGFPQVAAHMPLFVVLWRRAVLIGSTCLLFRKSVRVILSPDSVALHTTAGVRHGFSATGNADRGTARRRPC